jgi:hypothetical protein
VVSVAKVRINIIVVVFVVNVNAPPIMMSLV